MIDEENLPRIKKLQYLRLSLTGKAASCIETLDNTEENYEIAIRILKDKYEHTRRTTRHHWTIMQEYLQL